MLRSSLLALGVASLAVASPSPAPEPNLLDLFNTVKDKVTTSVHKTLGLKSCASPLFLPQSCVNGKSVAEVSKIEIDGCCTNVPGGLLLQTQFWDTAPATGPNNSWTIHGLWPDNCDGTYEQFCDPDREYENIHEILGNHGRADLLSYMSEFWLDYQGNDESFQSHEWSKHGTCISSLNSTCYGATDKSTNHTQPVVDYFERTIELFKTLPTYDWLAEAGILPSTEKTYTLEQLQAVAKKHHGFEIYWGCTAAGALDEAWYFYNSKGPVAGGKFIPVVSSTKSSCPATGIKYLPKVKSSSGGGSTTPTNPGAGAGVAGKARFYGLKNGAQSGGIINSGLWGTGTPASLTVAAVDESVTEIVADTQVTIHSSKGGPCAIVDAAFSCASSNTNSVFTISSDNLLTYEGSSTFYVDAYPTSTGGVAFSTAETSNAVTFQYSP